MVERVNLDYYDGETSANRTISITSGKGGVGKSNIVVNVSVQLAKLGKRVLVLDADFGLANIDILMNLQPIYTIEELFRNRMRIEKIITEGPLGVSVIPASSGFQEMSELTLPQQKYLISELSRIQHNYDFLIIDTGAGISSNVMRFNASVDEIIVVTNSEPTALTDAYAMMKVLTTKYQIKKFYLITNHCNEEEGLRIYNLLRNVARTHQNRFELVFTGSLPSDPNMHYAIKSRKPYTVMFPGTKMTKAFENITNHVNFDTSALTSQDKKSSFWSRYFGFSGHK